MGTTLQRCSKRLRNRRGLGASGPRWRARCGEGADPTPYQLDSAINRAPASASLGSTQELSTPTDTATITARDHDWRPLDRSRRIWSAARPATTLNCHLPNVVYSAGPRDLRRAHAFPRDRGSDGDSNRGAGSAMRFSALAASLVGTVVFGVLIPYNVVFLGLFLLCGILSAIGIWDLAQRRHSIRRNYPILANVRFMLEKIRPEIRQYFLESETDGTPFNRSKRAVAYQRAKGALAKRPFGTQQDTYGNNFDWINPSIVPCPIDCHDFRVTVGGAACRQPYALSLFNISAMSFGALSANAIRALNRGAKAGGFAHDTGEGGI